MPNCIMLVPVGRSVGLTTVSLGMVRAMEQKGINVSFYKPIAQPVESSHRVSNGSAEDFERSSEIIRNSSSITPPKSFTLDYAEQLFRDGNIDLLMEQIIGRLESSLEGEPLVIVEGLVMTHQQTYTGRLNKHIASALGAKIVLVAAPGSDDEKQLQDKIVITANHYGGVNDDDVLGCIINKLNAPLLDDVDAREGLLSNSNGVDVNTQLENLRQLPIFSRDVFDYVGAIPWNEDLVAPRAKDLSRYLNARIINQGDLEYRRLRSVNFCARSVANIVDSFKPSALIVTPGDRSDVIMAVCLSVMNGMKIGGLLLTGGFEPEPDIIALCQPAFDSGLPVILIDHDTWKTAQLLQHINLEVPVGDLQRIEKVKQHAGASISSEWIEKISNNTVLSHKKSPPAFRYQLSTLARKADKTIVLPEAYEPRIIKAAAICGQRKIARTILLGNRNEILKIAKQQGVELNDYVSIIDPDTHRARYIDPLVSARKSKGMTEIVAKEQLKDTVMMGTMMLAQGEVDGLVSGAVNTTANTIRPALQIIKTAPGSSLVSSIFFMLLPDQVLVYGDCAINPDPNAEQLADIAIQSADSAAAFGIEPKVAMISYSTGSSGTGDDVEKVRKATELAKAKRPDLIIDGPLQYDAAVMEKVAQKKAPNSPVAGQATVFVFPDLNTGNTTYKAVQRSASLVSIGPMLQGMAKPVNDLSRGALVDDIVYTIALTAIQAAQLEKAQ